MALTARIKQLFDFGTVQRSIASLDERLGGIEADIRATQAKRDQIANAPAHRADTLSMLESWVDAQATGWRTDLSATLRPHVVRAVGPGLVRKDLLSLVNPGSPYEQGAPASAADINQVLCAVFRDDVVSALRAIVEDATDWPAAGMPLNERAEAVAALDAQLAELNSELESLRRQAADLGIARY